MEKRRFMKENKGYSLIELIIVLAIIVVMTGVSMVTITIIHNARAREASTKFENALSELQQNAKGKMCVVSDTNEPDDRFALAIYKDNSKYYMKRGYYLGNNLDMSKSTSYLFVDSENGNGGKGESFSAYIKVKYVDESGVERDITEMDDKPVYIIYDRQGMCIYGNGKFNFYRDKKDSLLNTVVLNKNGSHTSN